MATFAARRLHHMLDNVANIVAIELLAAAQGVEFHHPQKSSAVIEKIIHRLRELSPPYAEDRSMSADITRVATLVDDGVFCEYSASILPSLNA
jgi:histidine ammonia-lyase